MERRNKIFFIDFDGTITKVDTCDAIMNNFADESWMAIEEMWRRKEISTEEWGNRLLQLIRASREELEKFLEGIEIDDHFIRFCELCNAHGHKIFVLSDGYDFNIETVLKKYGLSLPYYSNKLVYRPGERRIECPYKNPSCGKCGTCKKKLMDELKQDDCQIIYIGDAYSDKCPAGYADLVFAKDVLFNYCLKKGISAIHFKDFGDIISHLFPKLSLSLK